ncbi:hypothetical protein D3C77_348060 [compost metagenome]
MDRTQVADFATVTLDAGGLAWMQCRVLARYETELGQRTREAQQCFDVSLHIEEVDGVATVGPAFRQATATHHTSQHWLLLQVAQLADKAQAAFEQTHAVLLTVEVVLQRLDQARPQGGTHGRHVAGDRVGQQQRLDARAEQFEQFRVDEAVGDGFLIAAGNQQAAQGRQLATGFGLGLRGQARLRVSNRQAVVTVKAGQLFDQVDFQADVKAVAGYFDLPLPCFTAGFQAQRVEQALDFSSVHVHAEHLVDALGTQCHRCNLRQMLLADGFDNRTGVATDDVQQQASGALHGFAGELRVDTTLVAVRSVGVQAIGTGLASDRNWLEEGAFKEDVARGGRNTTVLAPHDAGDSQGAGMVGDHQGIAAQCYFLTIKQDELLALLGHAYADATVDFGEIERMQRLAQFEHYIVGDVDGSINAADVSATQALNHPQRGRTRQVDVADDTTQVTRARSRRQDFDWAHFVMHGGNGGNLRTSDPLCVQGANFTGKASQRQAVATVRGQVDLDAGVVQVQVYANVFANRSVGSQLQQAVVLFADL